MPRKPASAISVRPQSDQTSSAPPPGPRVPGMPAPDSIVRTTPLASVPAVGGGRQYQVITTTEVDAYDPGASPRGTLAVTAVAPVAPTGDQYAGSDRKTAKLSIGKKPVETFAGLKDLVASLPSDASMIGHSPKITTAPASRRVTEEQRQVHVSVFLYAASREADNDFHLILGHQRGQGDELYMTMELSGLPPQNNPAFAKLKAARDALKGFFQAQLPGMTYDFYDPPIPVEIEGSLFFDMTHAMGTKPGPKSLKDHMPTIWEVHPISQIVFKP